MDAHPAMTTNNGKQFLIVFFPMVVAFLAAKAISQIDLFMIARLGEEAVAAFAVPSRVMLIDMVLAFSIAPVVSVMVARATQTTERSDTIARALSLSFYVSLVVTGAGIIVYPRIVDAIIATDEVSELAKQATFWLTLSIPIRLMQFVGLMALHACGRGKLFLPVLFISLAIKVPLNNLLIYEFGWGFQGCFIATAAVSILELAATLWLLRSNLRASFWLRPPGLEWTRQFSWNAFPEAGRVLSYAAVQFTLLALYASNPAWLSRMSSYSVAFEMQVFLFMPMAATMRSLAIILASSTPLDGDSLYKMARTVAAVGGILAVSVGSAIFFGETLLGQSVYQLTPAAMAWWSPYTMIAVALVPVMFIGAVQRGIWHSQQRYNFVFFVEIATQWGILVPVTYLGLLWNNPSLAWSGLLVSEIVLGSILFLSRQSIVKQPLPLGCTADGNLDFARKHSD